MYETGRVGVRGMPHVHSPSRSRPSARRVFRFCIGMRVPAATSGLSSEGKGREVKDSESDAGDDGC